MQRDEKTARHLAFLTQLGNKIVRLFAIPLGFLLGFFPMLLQRPYRILRVLECTIAFAAINHCTALNDTVRVSAASNISNFILKLSSG